MQPDESASELAKVKLRDWYLGVVAQRLIDQSTGVIILVMHRIAPDDLSATLAEKGGWLHLSLPLIAETKELFEDNLGRSLLQRMPGDALNESRLSREDCDRLRQKLPSHVFDAQFQQRPSYGGSGFCTISRLARYGKASEFELLIHSWDIAATKHGGDWTVCTKFGLAKDPKLGDVFYLIGIVRMQIELPDVREAVITQDKVDKPALIVIDGNGIGLGVYQDLRKLGMKHIMRGEAMERTNSDGLKAKRFRLTLLNLYDGRVRIPNSLPGLETFLQELAAFPDGKHDDQVDSLSLATANMAWIVMAARQRRGS